jgi:uncharacterized protein (DUF433 family)
VVAEIASAESFLTVQEAYPLTREQVLAALRYAAHLATHPPAPEAVSG